MSVKRSWDVRREPVAAPVAAAPRKRVPLKARRKKARTIFFISLGVLLLLALAFLAWLVWQPFVRISAVTAEGPNSEALQAIATESMWGTYAYVLPKNSIFLYPEMAIRERMLAAYPAIAAVSITRTGFTSIHVKGIDRAPAFVWCGVAAAEHGQCFSADAEGLVFAPIAGEAVMLKAVEGEPAPIAAAPPAGALRIYAAIEQEAEDDGTPIKAHVVGASRIPDALRFVKAMSNLNVAIVSVEIRGDEADLYTEAGTRITYILGEEVDAAALAASAFPTLNVNSGLLEYVDLRFDGKVYIKRHGDPNA